MTTTTTTTSWRLLFDARETLLVVVCITEKTTYLKDTLAKRPITATT